MTKLAVQCGAGNIGRGFIGAELSKAGYEVVFADVVDPLIKEINSQRSYEIEILDVNSSVEKISNVRGVNSSSDAMTEALTKAEIVTTAVGAGILKFVAPAIAKGIQARRRIGAGPMNVIACENLVGNSSVLKDLVVINLKDEEDRKYLEEMVGFPNCSVDRIVPPFKGKSMLSVGVEQFEEWIVEEPALKGPRPDIPGMQFTDNLTAYVQRKLFTLNCGHAIAAYLGYLKGIETIDKAVADEEIRNIVIAAMRESGTALCRKHGFDEKKHEEYIQKIERRFQNPHVRDECTRVGREPCRKLKEGDRLIGPIRMTDEFGLKHDALLKGVAAALLYNNPEDPQSKDLQEKINKEGIENVLENVIGFKKGSEDSKGVLDAYNDFRKQYR